MTIINSLVDYLRGSKPKSATLAKERLQIILAHENARQGAPTYLPQLKQELLAVIVKYVAIDPEQIKMHLDRHENYDLLELNIVLPEGGKRQ